MGTQTSRQFPDPLDGIQLRTIRWKKKQLQNLPSLPEPISEDTGMVIPGVIEKDNHLPPLPASGEKSFQECLEGLGVEGRRTHGHQPSRTEGNSPIKTHLFSRRCMPEDRILHLRGNPRCTPGPMLLKMALIQTPKIEVFPVDPSMEFFYMPAVPRDRPRRSPPEVCVAGTPSCERSSGTVAFPNRDRMPALGDGKEDSRPMAPGNSQTSPEIPSDPWPVVSTGRHARKTGDPAPRHPPELQSRLLDNADTSTGWSEGNGLMSLRPHNCSSPGRAATTHEDDDRTWTRRNGRSPAAERPSSSQHPQTEIFSWPPPFEAAMVSLKSSMRNYLGRYV